MASTAMRMLVPRYGHDLPAPVVAAGRTDPVRLPRGAALRTGLRRIHNRVPRTCRERTLLLDVFRFGTAMSELFLILLHVQPLQRVPPAVFPWPALACPLVPVFPTLCTIPHNIRWLLSAQGKILRDDLDWGFGLRSVYWDADAQRELVRGRSIFKYKGESIDNAIAGSIVGVADLLGDWREELIVSVAGELRIYTTTIPANDRRICLMQDPLYRADVCIQAMGYTQSPMTTLCLSAD